MKSANIPDNEENRLSALYRYRILDTGAEQEFDDLTAIAAGICGTPTALMSLVDDKRQWFKSRHAMDASETGRDLSFCAHAILGSGIFEVRDAREDDRFFDNPLVTGSPNIAFYAGAPLISQEGHALGTLCVIDNQPRTLTDRQKNALDALGRQVVRQMEMRLQVERERDSNAELERRVDARTAELQQAAADLQMLSHSIAHDLRQPLIALNGFIGLLKPQVSGERTQHYLSRIDASVRQIDVRADALLYFANLSRASLSWERVDMGAIAAAQIAALQSLEPGRRVTTRIATGLIVWADLILMTRVMRELLQNAWRFTAPCADGRIEVASQKDSDGSTFYYVQDNGAGFDNTYVDTLFDPFLRLDAGPEGPGDGLGLARVKRIVLKHGGRVWADSQKGKTTFYFTLAA